MKYLLAYLFFVALVSSQANYVLPATERYYMNKWGIVSKVLPITGGYYINTGTVIPGILPSKGGYYINAGTVVPSIDGYYVNTETVVSGVGGAVLSPYAVTEEVVARPLTTQSTGYEEENSKNSIVCNPNCALCWKWKWWLLNMFWR